MISEENIISNASIESKKRRRIRPVSILMNLYVYPVMILWTTGCILISPLLYSVWRFLLRWETDRIIRLFIWLYGRGWIVLTSPFISFRRVGFKGVNYPTPCIFVINHLSFFDTFCMAMLPEGNVAFAVAAWPFKMLWFTPFMRMARYLDVQSDPWELILEKARAIFERGGSVLFFPEGHRSRDGAVKRFYSGAFRMAIETGTPIVPLCISGTDTLLPPGSYLLKPTRITFKKLEPVYPEGFDGETGPKMLREYVRKLIQEEVSNSRRETE